MYVYTYKKSCQPVTTETTITFAAATWRRRQQSKQLVNIAAGVVIALTLTLTHTH